MLRGKPSSRWGGGVLATFGARNSRMSRAGTAPPEMRALAISAPAGVPAIIASRIIWLYWMYVPPKASARLAPSARLKDPSAPSSSTSCPLSFPSSSSLDLSSRWTSTTGGSLAGVTALSAAAAAAEARAAEAPMPMPWSGAGGAQRETTAALSINAFIHGR
eukprot:scaffold24586_cov111-Isochrysis_galbana.AAC.7